MALQRGDVSVDDAFRTAARVLRRRTSSVLPYYALAAATVDVTRLPLLVGAVVAYLALASTGRLRPLLDDLAGLNPELLRPDSPAGLPPDVAERLASVLFSPAVVVPLAVAALVAVVVTVLAQGVTRAAALSALEAAVDERKPLVAGVRGMRRWKTFAGLVLVRWGLLLVAGVPFLAAVVGGVVTLGTATDPAALDQGTVVAVLGALVGGLLTLLAVVVVLALLAFAGPAVVVEDADLGRAVRRSVGVPFAHPVGFLLYGVVVVGSYVLLGVATVLFGIAGVERLVTVGSAFVVSPLLDGVAVALYAGWAASDRSDGDATDGSEEDATDGSEEDATDGSEEDATDGSDGAGTDRSEETAGGGPVDEGSGPTAESDESVVGFETDDDGRTSPESTRGPAGLVGTVRDALASGVAELGRFVRTDWRYVVVSGAALVAGIVAGWTATAGSGVRIDTPADPGAVFGLVPVGPFVTIAVNNWFVATTAGFSGLFAGLPTLGTLLFNGLLVGAVAGVVDPVAFVAFVGPHGVVELPAIAVAGGVGLRLGHVAWGVWRGTRPSASLADELGRTWRVVVGLAVVFVVAGFVEAFVTPQVAAAVLG